MFALAVNSDLIGRSQLIMFEELYDRLSMLWSWRWPTATGEVTEALAERLQHGNQGNTFRLAVAYEFSLAEDGPYTGESFWTPAFCQKRRVISARRKFRRHQKVYVRYRPNDASINKLDRSVWRGL
jgi:hypothetical protein